MSTLIMTRGLPGCGKSTWAAEQVLNGLKVGKKVVVVNKDSIRLELDQPWSKELEKQVLEIRDQRIMDALGQGLDVISDDTNFARKHKVRFAQIASAYGAKLEIKDFSHIPVDVCIERDSKRKGTARVGEDVIWKMYDQYLRPQQVKVEKFKPSVIGLPEALICDLDGTLSLFDEKGHRGPYDASKSNEDEVCQPVAALLLAMKDRGTQLLFVSGREEVYKAQTLEFLALLGFDKEPLFMRKKGDFRKDWIVKNELFMNHIADKWSVIFVIDDRPQVLRMWRQLGLFTLQVGDGHEF